MPNSHQEWVNIAEDFEKRWQFPNCIGALDGKHVSIVRPKNAGSTFYNYKKAHSINLMVLADSNYKIIYFDVGSRGRSSDGGVFKNCSFFKSINQLNIPPMRTLPNSNNPILMPFVIVADNAFSLTNFLMKPYSSHDLTQRQKIFNYRISRARRVVENTFGIMANRFRILKTSINLKLTTIKICIAAVCALHNFLLTEKSSEYYLDSPSTVNVQSNNTNEDYLNASADARETRERFEEYFNSEQGSVPWQYDAI